MLVILLISVFEYTYFLKSVFLSIYDIYSLGHIFIYTSFGPYNFLAPLPGIGAIHFLSLEVDILKDKRFANLGNFYFYFWLRFVS